MADHLLDESDHEDPFASPSKKPAKEPERSKTPSNQNNRYDDSEDVREAVLQRELEGVRNINELIEGVTVSNTVNTASTLLNTWTCILSQTEHNQRLILNPTWKGATQDLADVENEALQRQQQAERRAAEEERRRAEARRRHEEEQQRQTSSTTSSVGRTPSTRRGTRGVSDEGCEFWLWDFFLFARG
ncbi:putative dash complex subunit duo1 protein [Eutypa lata UCREL1]|uniref:DASH complex subunit DUO1 n=1 Tax=Eutypa lata (strain UCR-EL1) TaxID=1287681 RepID=M7T3F2_EUTLA|nr:putative dash complex subunit duo1 protein [Eutypa lata UCREL1]